MKIAKKSTITSWPPQTMFFEISDPKLVIFDMKCPHFQEFWYSYSFLKFNNGFSNAL